MCINYYYYYCIGLIDKPHSIVYEGIGMAVSNENILAVKILTGEATSYSSLISATVGDAPQSAGTDTLLVTGIQGRNNARITFSGSLFLFSNEALTTGIYICCYYYYYFKKK